MTTENTTGKKHSNSIPFFFCYFCMNYKCVCMAVRIFFLVVFPVLIFFVNRHTHTQALKHTQIPLPAVEFICFVVELSCWYMKAEATIVKPFNILYVLTKAYAELMGFIFCPESKRVKYGDSCRYLCVCVCEIHMDNGQIYGDFFVFVCVWKGWKKNHNNQKWLFIHELHYIRESVTLRFESNANFYQRERQVLSFFLVCYGQHILCIINCICTRSCFIIFTMSLVNLLFCLVNS